MQKASKKVVYVEQLEGFISKGREKSVGLKKAPLFASSRHLEFEILGLMSVFEEKWIWKKHAYEHAIYMKIEKQSD